QPVTEKRLVLPAAVQGTFALANDEIVLPLADGSLFRRSLTADTGAVGPHWRSPRADADALGHITFLGGTDFLITNGSTGIRRLSWQKEEWKMGEEVQLPDRIAAVPLLLPPAQPNAVPLVCIVGSKGNLMLLKSDDLKPDRIWEL